MWTGAYIVSIVLVNWLFLAVPGWSTPVGELNIANVIVGFVFVLRDYAQREIGQKVLLATLAAGVATYVMVDKALAVASLTAFLLSETVDWAIFTFWRRPLQERILVSSLVSVPLDTLAFLSLAGFLTPIGFAVQVVGKAVGVLLVWFVLRTRPGGPAPAVP